MKAISKQKSRMSACLCKSSPLCTRSNTDVAPFVCIRLTDFLFLSGRKSLFYIDLSATCPNSVSLRAKVWQWDRRLRNSVWLWVKEKKKRSRDGWMVKLFGTYYQGTVFEPRRHRTWNDLGQVTNGCLSRSTRPIVCWLRCDIHRSLWLVCG